MGNLFVKIAEFNPVNATQSRRLQERIFPAQALRHFLSGCTTFDQQLMTAISSSRREIRRQATIAGLQNTDWLGHGSPPHLIYPLVGSSSTGVALAINLQRDTGRSPVTLEAYLFGMRTTYVNTVVASRTIGGNYLNQSNWTSDMWRQEPLSPRVSRTG